MNVKKLILAAAIGAGLNTALAADIKPSDSIAAVVDNEVITQRQVAQAVADARRDLPKGEKINDEDLRRQVLAQMINQSLIVQAGKRRNIRASEAEIDAVIAANPSLKNASKAVRRSIADNIIMEKVRQQAVMQNSRVSESEIDHFIAQAEQQGVALPEGEPMRQYRAQHILLKADNDNAAAAAESSIRKIHTQARSGADFSSLAQQYSQDVSAGNGGDLGWFADGMMVAQFEDAVHKLKPGQISAPVRTEFGWHIIKLNEVRDAGTPEERRRNSVRQYLSQQKAQQATTDLLRDLHNSAFVDVR
ncbi:peptidylprolyl isomerase [Neisseria animalis]|uniref:Peptidylprolyl isomerase n=1 Tax=Neisseria animalis TaxID=492 RepID=A0A5P3MQ75_NEIAN|nr:peptidylprolyl isomerase [Neisseria animalis]QEY23704.1 peptidylprolyl isomerase [Neisseria animalis]ROW32847.1 peptidylprolyl isomerase [Neisseria animalis]VEE09524.1 peptidyl-prolyl cis-trans isomerase [Neisseria animalis]